MAGFLTNLIKVARIIPIFKRGSEICINNYRPISLLSVFNRIMEKIVYKGLIKCIDHNTILCANQFRFRSEHSTLDAIMSITDKVQNAIEKGFYSCGLFLDLP